MDTKTMVDTLISAGKATDDYVCQSEENTKQAFDVIKKSKIISTFENIGARVNLVGSLAIGVLGKHLDIDFHVYTKELDVCQSFGAIAIIAANPAIKKVEFSNLGDSEECCLEWHLWFEAARDKLWQIDIIQIKEGSFYDGYFEKMAKDIKAALTKETRERILQLKFETPDTMKICGIEYYKAVVFDDIKDFKSFLDWRKTHPLDGIMAW